MDHLEVSLFLCTENTIGECVVGSGGTFHVVLSYPGVVDESRY